MKAASRVGADTGGTFTDLVAGDGTVVKVMSTPEDPSFAVSEGLARIGQGPPEALAHGTTVATNALLERSGATVALLTTTGFADVIEIARQDRPALYDQWRDRPEPLVERDLRFEVGGRIAADGGELVPVSLSDLPILPARVQAVAVCFLHADRNDAHERSVSAALASRGLHVSRSSQVSPEFREYERTVTTVVNAYLGPVCGGYVERLEGLGGEVTVMTSAGGLTPLEEAVTRPAALLLSGPAAGVRAAAAEAEAAGYPDAVTFDMGGTSTDVCLVRDGVPDPAAQRTVAGFPIRMPSLDVHTIGAGGGSIASIDPGGALTVGPRSAGSRPGPACYAMGGTDPTVTDADLVAGRIPEGLSLPGIGMLDVAAARAALSRAGVTAEGVLAVVDAAMVQAIRTVTVERGVDPRGLALVAFGGAGPLHACSLASALGMRAVVVPPRAGVLSAVGLLCARRQVDLVRSWSGAPDSVLIERGLTELSQDACRALGNEQVAAVETAVDCRYAGQSHELTVSGVEDFPAEHERRNGYARPGQPIEVMALRARAIGRAPLDLADLPSPARRADVTGPTAIAEQDCTIWVPDGWHARVEEGGSWVLKR